ncbi:MAG: mannonate dehydratase [Alphaproteobacteria bacterium]|nr:mannonate dehydratase [Alphaproteobacteria bacterium]
MRQTWRWFGPKDHVSVDDMLQSGVEGVVSALHHVPTGEVWRPEEIAARQEAIRHMRDGSPSGLEWEVVESLPVSEDIKKQKGDWRSHIENWKQSLAHIADAGIEVVCYNFMPVLDWTRTDLAWRRPSGATCMRFDLADFAVFDIHILKRPGAAEDYSEEVADEAARRFAEMDEKSAKRLTENIVFGLPGAAESFTLEDVRAHLQDYAGIDADSLRSHMTDFLGEVSPVAQSLGLRLCCHPDDPPFPLLGLPRVMSTEEDYAKIMRAVDIPANGITLCAGSLGSRPDNDLPGMMRNLGDRVHFLHLRNVAVEGDDICNSFYETMHLEGDTDMVAMIAAVLEKEKGRRAEGRADWNIPMRPDHGLDILDDLGREGQPGYPTIGRMRGLAELRGVMTALSHSSVSAG